MKPNRLFDIPVKEDIKILNRNLINLVPAQDPILYAASEHLLTAGGKRLRPSIVLLVSKAINEKILPSQHRLAEITEIIHTASLIHDDVIDDCSTRRGIKAVHTKFNNKIAVLAGDFLFAKSSWYLANLNQLEVVKIISKVITDFAEGEVKQSLSLFDITLPINNYIEKSFYKTASLIASSCQAASMLTSNNYRISLNLYLYGKHLGIAFQIIDDILDMISSGNILGKPEKSDLKNGNLTAPCLFTLFEQGYIKKIIKREFCEYNDIEIILKEIKTGRGILKAKDLASEHLQASLNCLKYLKESDSKQSLQNLTEYILNRLY
uniref:Prenyl transferase n=1 Tax=Boldia erythrosiphon TaxID=74908 RepID=A0A1Y9TM05_9RHOD|nr:prenyl transferase [Boldia erythrosiphon]ARO90655.1 prenyl transferase [Boldia erythrosiphon]